MRDVARVADARDPIDDIARVLVERVVHRRRVIRTAAVVVDTQAASDVDVLQSRAHELELRVDVRQLVDGIFHAPDVLQLAAGMAVHELQAIQHAARLQYSEELHDLGDEEAEFRLLARGLPPAARAFGEELHPHAEARPHLIALGVLQDEPELIEVLHHRNDGPPELRGQRHRLDIAVVLEAVADDQPFGSVLGHRHHGEELGLRADLEAEAEVLAVAVDLLDHQALLVHLDGEYGRVAVAVVVLGDRLREGGVQMLQAMRQDIGEAHHHRGGQVPSLQALDDIVEVDVPAGLRVGAHHDVTGCVDAEVTLAPRIDVVELQGVLDAPGLGRVELAGAVQGALRVYGHVRESAIGLGEFTGRARYQNCVTCTLAKIVETIFGRPYTFRRGPGNGPGPLRSAADAPRRKKYLFSRLAGDRAVRVADPLAPGTGVEPRSLEPGHFHG